jgi:O-antigen/teichoic acid export membrane protein
VQALRSLAFKIPSVFFSLMTVSLTLNYLGVESYGVWVTLVSLISWTTFFDLGMGNGMRNKVAQALALNDYLLARSYITTTYSMVLVLAIVIFCVVLMSAYLIDWQWIFNTQASDNATLRSVFIITALFSLTTFVLSVINSVMSACQKTSFVDLNQLLISISWFVMILVLSEWTDGSMQLLSLANGVSAAICAAVISWSFYRSHEQLVPKIELVDYGKVNELISLGGKFFVMQLAYLIIFTTDNMIITQILGPEYVTEYSIVFKLFSLITLVSGVLTANLWSAYTEAFAKRDILWIKNSLKAASLLMIPVMAGSALLAYFAKDIALLWLQKDINLSSMLIACMALYVVVSSWCQIFSYFLNGVGAVINIQVFLSIFGALINIPLSIFLARDMQMGSSGVILGTVLSLSIFAIVGPILTLRIIRKMELDQP